jgi:hypothetical protein
MLENYKLKSNIWKFDLWNMQERPLTSLESRECPHLEVLKFLWAENANVGDAERRAATPAGKNAVALEISSRDARAAAVRVWDFIEKFFP